MYEVGGGRLSAGRRRSNRVQTCESNPGGWAQRPHASLIDPRLRRRRAYRCRLSTGLIVSELNNVMCVALRHGSAKGLEVTTWRRNVLGNGKTGCWGDCRSVGEERLEN